MTAVGRRTLFSGLHYSTIAFYCCWITAQKGAIESVGFCKRKLLARPPLPLGEGTGVRV